MSTLPLHAVAAPGAPTITAPVHGSVRNDNPLTVEGTAPTGAVSVRLFDGATALGDTGVIGGAWRIGVALADGPHTLSARARDAAGNYGAASDA
ncbi:MAG TPA: Ig-like domain-containing protein, partial [Actinomycetota bacterium]|nr:Ig-like domain-containing protein [Actinomycetota bacterium]